MIIIMIIIVMIKIFFNNRNNYNYCNFLKGRFTKKRRLRTKGKPSTAPADANTAVAGTAASKTPQAFRGRQENKLAAAFEEQERSGQQNRQQKLLVVGPGVVDGVDVGHKKDDDAVGADEVAAGLDNEDVHLDSELRLVYVIDQLSSYWVSHCP